MSILILLILSLFIFGLFVGSFLNVLADRLPREETVLKGRSHCESCGHSLSWKDLIPLFSFISLQGKCRYCRSTLSYYYPIVEMTTGVLFAVTAYFILSHNVILSHSAKNLMSFEILHGVYPAFSGVQNDMLALIFHLFIVSSLIVIFFADLKYGIIPDKVTFPVIFVSLAYIFIIHYSLIINHVLSGLGVFILFLFLFLITKGRGMGFGDVKLAFLLGLFLGFPNIVVALYVAFLTGSLVSSILIICGKKKLKGSTIPFGPFLVFGALVSLFYGELLAHYGLSMLGL